MFAGIRRGDLSDMLDGLIVSALMLFCVIALAFTARVDRVPAPAPEPVPPTESDSI
jgi:hypothetical protein